MLAVRVVGFVDGDTQGGQNKFSPGTGGAQREVAGFGPGVLDGNLQMIFRQAIAHAACPFDQAQPVWAVKIFFAADGKEFIGTTESPCIEVCDGDASVGVQLQQYECGTVDELIIDTQSFAESAGKVSFSSPQFAIESDGESG